MNIEHASSTDPYEVVDPVLMPWARKHDICIFKLDRDWHVRSFDVYDRRGNRGAYVWLELPDLNGAVTVVAAGAGGREERHATLDQLADVLDELLPIVLAWCGPDAFTSRPAAKS